MAAQVTIAQLPTATTLTGDELVPTVQNGVTVKTTTQDIVNLALGDDVVTTFNSRTGAVVLANTDVTGALGYTPGSVTSVGGTGTVSGLTLSGTVTTAGVLNLSGTLAVTPSNFASQTANYVLAAPNGSAGVPTFRAIVAADIPTLNQNTTGTAANVTGTVAVANGGTGATSAATALSNLGAYPASNPSGYTSNTGTVTTVGTGSGLTGGPINTTGTINLANAYGDTVNPYASKTANNFLAAPNGSAGVPTFRAIAAADVPTLNQNTTGTAANVTGIVAVANGGTGTATPALVAGTNVTISGAWPNQTINSSGGGGGALAISNISTTYTVAVGDLGKILNATSGGYVISLPSAATVGAGFYCYIWNTQDGFTSISVSATGGQNIDGRTTLVLNGGNGFQVVSDGANWWTGSEKTLRSYAENFSSTLVRPTSSGSDSVAIAGSAQATSIYTLAIGYNCQATNFNASAIARGDGGVSSVSSGSGSTVLGGGVANALDSLAIKTARDFGTTYGATATNAIAAGKFAKAGGIRSTAWGPLATANGESSAVFGDDSAASQKYSTAIGFGASSAMQGKYAYAGGRFAASGDSQLAVSVLRASTTNAVTTNLTPDGTALSATNQLGLANTSAMAFSGLVVARQQAVGGTQSAAWKIEGLIRREGSAATTVLVTSTVTAISNVPAWAVSLSADTTNGGLIVTGTGAVATNVRWVATIQASEVINP